MAKTKRRETKRRTTKRNRIKRKYSKKIRKTRHKKRKTKKNKKKIGGFGFGFNFFLKEKTVAPSNGYEKPKTVKPPKIPKIDINNRLRRALKNPIVTKKLDNNNNNNNNQLKIVPTYVYPKID